jgi:hypothetical protein
VELGPAQLVRGRVARFDPKDGQHFLTEVSGTGATRDSMWVDLRTKKYRVQGDNNWIENSAWDDEDAAGTDLGMDLFDDNPSPYGGTSTYGGTTSYGSSTYGSSSYTSYSSTQVETFVEYTSTDPEASTTVTFHVWIEPTLVKYEEGERVCVRGNVDALGRWGVLPPLVLRSSGWGEEGDADSNIWIWEGSVSLPFLPDEACATGLFQYQYTIEQIDAESGEVTGDSTEEGGYTPRTVKSLENHCYDMFKHNYASSRFRGVYAYRSVWGGASARSNESDEDVRKTPDYNFLSKEVARFMKGEIDTAALLNRNMCLCEDIDDAAMRSAELVFDDVIRSQIVRIPELAYLVGKEAQASPDGSLPQWLETMRLQFMALLALIGSHQRTSCRPKYTSTTTNYYSRSSDANKDPVVRLWVSTVAEVDARIFVHFDAKKTVGEHYKWCANGIAEAVERMAFQGSYEWLPMMPALLSGSLEDEANVDKALFHKHADDHFAKDALTVLNLILEFNGGTRGSSGAKPQPKSKTRESKTSESTKLVRDWVRCLIRFAPSFQGVLDLFSISESDLDASDSKAAPRPGFVTPGQTEDFILQFFGGGKDNEGIPASLYVEFFRKFKEFPLSDEDLVCIHELQLRLPRLCCVDTATSILQNDEDGDADSDNILNIVAACIPEAMASGAVDKDRDGESASELVSAAKSWLRNQHAKFKALEAKMLSSKSSYSTSGYTSFYGGYSGSNYRNVEWKKPTYTEQLHHRIRKIVGALEDCDLILRIPFFAAPAQSRNILYELGRCGCFRADAALTLKSLSCLVKWDTSQLPNSIVKSDVHYGTIGRDLQGFVLRQGRLLVQEIMTTTTRWTKVFETLDDVDLSAPLMRVCAYTVAQIVTCPRFSNLDSGWDVSQILQPTLEQLLVGSGLWQMLFEMYGDDADVESIVNGTEDGASLSAGSSNGTEATELAKSIEHAATIFKAGVGLSKTLLKIRVIFGQVAQNVADTTLDVQSLHTIMQHEDLFSTFMEHFSAGHDGRSLLLLPQDAGHPSEISHPVSALLPKVRELKGILKRFDTTREHISCYMNCFCSIPGIKVSAAGLHVVMSKVSKNYTELKLCEVGNIFKSIEAVDNVGWLFPMRSSSLFFNLWRKCAWYLSEFKPWVKRPLEDDTGGYGVFELFSLFDDDDEAEAEDSDLSSNVQDADEGSAGAAEATVKTAQEQAELDTLLLECMSLSQSGNAYARTKEELSQEIMCVHLIPMARKLWDRLSYKVQTGEINVLLMEKTFGLLSGEEVERELQMLVATSSDLNDMHSYFSASTQAPKIDLSQLSCTILDFLMLQQISRWIPLVIEVRKHLSTAVAEIDTWDQGELVTTAFDDDELLQRLRAHEQKIALEWGHQKLATISLLVDPTRDFFEGLSQRQLEFISMLGEKMGCVFLGWLLEHSSTEQFNRLMEVCRPNTDNKKTLNSIASLDSVRALLQPVLYQGPPYANFGSFCGAFQKVDVSDQDLVDLKNILKNFTLLLDLFNNQTQSPGIKAIHDLAVIEKHGCFVFRTGGSSCMFLEIDHTGQMGQVGGGSSLQEALDAEESTQAEPTDPADASAAVNTSTDMDGREEDTGLQIESLEYLFDLRGKLMMTEIPDKLREELNAEALVNAFISQLQTLSEIADVVMELFAAGCQRYQEDFELRISFDVDGHTALLDKLEMLIRDRAQLDGLVKRTREKHYFLNYFTMQETLDMQSKLDALSEMGEQKEGQTAVGDGERHFPVPMSDVDCEDIADEQSMPAFDDFKAETSANVGRFHALFGGPNSGTSPANSLSCDNSVVVAPEQEEGPPAAAVTVVADLDDVAAAEDLISDVELAVDEFTSPLPPMDVDYKEILSSVLMVHDKDKLFDMDAMLLNKKGQEDLFFASLCASYHCFNPLPDEIARLAESRVQVCQDEISSKSPEDGLSASANGDIANSSELFSAEAVGWTCPFCTFQNIDPGANNCEICGGQRPREAQAQKEETVVEDVGDGDVEEEGKSISLRDILTASFQRYLFLISSTVPSFAAELAAHKWKQLRQPASNVMEAKEINVNGLDALGAILDDIFMRIFNIRDIQKPPPSISSNQYNLILGDLAVLDVETGKRSLPVWACQADRPNQVISILLSLFACRGRLPEPGEILFCTPETTTEDVLLLLRRFISGRQNGRSEHVFCLADVHVLSYTVQCTTIELLREFVSEYGTENAASLMILSGLPGQVILSALSSHKIDLPPLPRSELQAICTEAFTRHCGQTTVVRSGVNGGGKTHHIMASVAEMQKADPKVQYRRVPFRESTTSVQLVEKLSQHMFTDERTVFHIDVGHVIPQDANTLLFELLLIGVLRSKTVRKRQMNLAGKTIEFTIPVYHRSARDSIFIEIANSAQDRTYEALSLAQIVPTSYLEVGEKTLSLSKVSFKDKCPTKIVLSDCKEITTTCKWLRAFRNGKLDPRSRTFDILWDINSDGAINSSECYQILHHFCCEDVDVENNDDNDAAMNSKLDSRSNPSFSAFSNFAYFMVGLYIPVPQHFI